MRHLFVVRKYGSIEREFPPPLEYRFKLTITRAGPVELDIFDLRSYFSVYSMYH